jgi:hypothetical protein
METDNEPAVAAMISLGAPGRETPSLTQCTMLAAGTPRASRATPPMAPMAGSRSGPSWCRRGGRLPDRVYRAPVRRVAVSPSGSTAVSATRTVDNTRRQCGRNPS